MTPPAFSAATAATNSARAVEVGMGRPQDAAQPPVAAQPPLDVEQVGLHPRGAGLVEAGLDDAGGCGQRREVAALVPGAAGRPRHRGNHRDSRRPCAPPRGSRRPATSPTSQRQSRNARELAVAPRVGEPEGLGHVGREVDVAGEIGVMSARMRRLQAGGIDAGRLGARRGNGRRSRGRAGCRASGSAGSARTRGGSRGRRARSPATPARCRRPDSWSVTSRARPTA